MTIDEALDARRHEGLRLSVWPASNGYQANLSGDNGKSWRVEMAADPCTAMKKALGLLPGASGPLWQPATPKGVFD